MPRFEKRRGIAFVGNWLCGVRWDLLYLGDGICNRAGVPDVWIEKGHMKREEILNKLLDHHPEVKAMGIESLSLFGSAARDEATPGSDVDLLVTFAHPVGLFQYTRVRRRLSEILGAEVDLVTPAALRKEMREEILREAVRAA
jgi:predicted nucleotidyltransferase